MSLRIYRVSMLCTHRPVVFNVPPSGCILRRHLGWFWSSGGHFHFRCDVPTAWVYVFSRAWRCLSPLDYPLWGHSCVRGLSFTYRHVHYLLSQRIHNTIGFFCVFEIRNCRFVSILLWWFLSPPINSFTLLINVFSWVFRGCQMLYQNLCETVWIHSYLFP